MRLKLADGHSLDIHSLEELCEQLSLLESAQEGDVIELFDTDKHSIRATRDDELWYVTARPKGSLFRQSLTTGDWIDFSKRKKQPFWVARGKLSDQKVHQSFCEFFERKKLSQPIEGALS